MNKFFTIIISIALLSFFGYFYLYPSYTTWQEDVEKLEEAQNKLETRNQYFEELKEIEKKLKDHKEGLAKIESALPDNFSLPKLYNYLQKRGAEYGLVVQELDSKEIKNQSDQSNNSEATSTNGKNELKQKAINIKLSGSYSNLKDFIKEIEKSARLFSVESFSIEAPKDLDEEVEEQIEELEEGEEEEEGEEGEEDEESNGQVLPFSIQLKVYSH
ncbi:MAG: type 4a pilus biogenesis protein PilO [Minisyncoccales bacterium]